MDLFERVKDILGDKVGEFAVRVEIVDDRIVCVFGGGAISYISDEEISLYNGKRQTVILGRDLKVLRCVEGEVYIVGEIASVEKK